MTAAIALTLLLSVSAFAQSGPTSAQYGDTVTQASQGPGGSDTPQSVKEKSPPADRPPLEHNIVGGLPFTGLDVIALFAVAVALTALGFALRRLTLTPE